MASVSELNFMNAVKALFNSFWSHLKYIVSKPLMSMSGFFVAHYKIKKGPCTANVLRPNPLKPKSIMRKEKNLPQSCISLPV